MARLAAWGGGALAVLGLACCFTPLLPIVLGAAGANGLLALVYRDAVLLPLAAFGLLVSAAGIYAMRRGS